MEALAAAALVIAACGGSSTPSTTSKGTLTVGGFNFPESDILVQLYGPSLAHRGDDVQYKPDLGTRAVVVPAIQSGQIDLYPGYAASELEYLNKGKGEATPDAQVTTDKLNTYLKDIGAQALTPSQAFDGNAYAVTEATAAQYS